MGPLGTARSADAAGALLWNLVQLRPRAMARVVASRRCRCRAERPHLPRPIVGEGNGVCYLSWMSTPARRSMTVDEFLVWAEAQPGRWELYNGVPYAMAPERAGHGKVKFAVQTALVQGIRKAGLPCHMLPDGAAVRVSQRAAHEPDALVYCGAELSRDAIEVPNPVVVVEVASTSTRRIDASLKLTRAAERAALPHCRSGRATGGPSRLPAGRNHPDRDRPRRHAGTDTARYRGRGGGAVRAA